MPKRMTQRQLNQIADKLLRAAKHWQNGKSRPLSCFLTHEVNEAWEASYSVVAVHETAWDGAASAALSEAARLADTELVDAATGE